MIDLSSVDKERLAGCVIGKNTKDLFLCVGGIHGNEREGVTALENVINNLNQHSGDINGSLVGLRGNLKAIKEYKRYIDYDMNRIWRKSFIDKILYGIN